MSFKESIVNVFQNYANFSGRARRSEYWYFTLFIFLVSAVLSGLNAAVFGTDAQMTIFTVIQSLFSLATLIPSIAVTVRRLHDIGKSGWFYFLILIPVVGSIILLVWECKDSEPGTNVYGPNPKGVY
jgi:uncharacterized membrane protein YhaH (DUF805 family)